MDVFVSFWHPDGKQQLCLDTTTGFPRRLPFTDIDQLRINTPNVEVDFDDAVIVTIPVGAQFMQVHQTLVVGEEHS